MTLVSVRGSNEESMMAQISPLKKNDSWSTCPDHDWQIDESDWDGPPDFEYVICSKCECPGQRHIDSGQVEWPTT